MAEDNIHDIRDTTVSTTADGFVVVCACGWTSFPLESMRATAEAWQAHRSSAEAARRGDKS